MNTEKWEYWQDDRPGKEGQVSITSEGKLIASIRFAPARREEAGACGRLIAQAPALLEALRDAATVLGVIVATAETAEPSDIVGLAAKVELLACAAIKAARE